MPLLLLLSGVVICAPLGAQGLGAQGAPPKLVLFGLILGPRRGDNLSFLGVGGGARQASSAVPLC